MGMALRLGEVVAGDGNCDFIRGSSASMSDRSGEALPLVRELEVLSRLLSSASRACDWAWAIAASPRFCEGRYLKKHHETGRDFMSIDR